MITRFAPSPSGLLHLGHAYSALIAWEAAKSAGGVFLLRIEDIDTARSKAEFETAIYDDLHWLGLDWPTPVLRQSDRQPAYEAALAKLDDLGLLYACNCTRRDIETALQAPQEGDAPFGPDGPIYPGICRDKSRARGNAALRLNMRRAINFLGPRLQDLDFREIGPRFEGIHRLSADHLIHQIGDIVLARKDIGTSYHLSVVVDDAAQGITLVPRGEDMFAATYIHRLLQALLEVPTPDYLHHQLIRDENGKRLAKRDDSRAISAYRDAGLTPEGLRDLVFSAQRLG